MVDALHAAGLEVLLDVVFNHTAESTSPRPHAVLPRPGQPGVLPARPGDPSRYVDTTGCGNSLNAGDPLTLQLIMDSLRYWITEMHVDGYRFDLAPTLARQDGGFDQVSAFFDLVAQDPVVPRPSSSPSRGTWARWTPTTSAASRRCGASGTASTATRMRDFWRSHPIGIGEFATRFCGSSDLYSGPDRRRPTASVNLFTVHDGFTLAGPGLLQRQAQRGQRREQPRRDQRQPLLELRRGGRRPTDPDILALRQRPVPGHAHHLAAVVRRADAARRGRVRPHPAGQQQRLLPGQRDHLVRLVRRGR